MRGWTGQFKVNIEPTDSCPAFQFAGEMLFHPAVVLFSRPPFFHSTLVFSFVFCFLFAHRVSFHVVIPQPRGLPRAEPGFSPIVTLATTWAYQKMLAVIHDCAILKCFAQILLIKRLLFGPASAPSAQTAGQLLAS